MLNLLTDLLAHPVIAFIIVIGVLIFVHELGHFMTAKLVDIEVPRFSIGFGPRVIGFKRGETEYVISALPLGGYVKMAGMEEMEHIEGPATVNDTPGDTPPDVPRTPRPRDFESKSLPARALVISAGVLMNVLFAIVVFSLRAGIWGVATDPGSVIGRVSEVRLPAEAREFAGVARGARVVAVAGQPVANWRDVSFALSRAAPGPIRIEFDDATGIDVTLPAGDSLRALLLGAIEPILDVPAVLADVRPDGPAARAGLRSGDRVVRAGGVEVQRWQQLVDVIERNPGQPVPLVVERGGQRLELTVTPRDSTLATGSVAGFINVQGPGLPRQRPTPLQAMAYGLGDTRDITVMTLDFLGGIFTRRHSARDIGGPIAIAQMSGQFAGLGLESLLWFMAVLSINLAILNLLPIPVLDGGHLVFLGIEAIRGRPLSLDMRMRLTQVGFVFIILLMAWAFGNDLLRVFGV